MSWMRWYHNTLFVGNRLPVMAITTSRIGATDWLWPLLEGRVAIRAPPRFAVRVRTVTCYPHETRLISSQLGGVSRGLTPSVADEPAQYVDSQCRVLHIRRGGMVSLNRSTCREAWLSPQTV